MEKAAQRRVDEALKHWSQVRRRQMEESRTGGRAQQGNRSAVTGGAHLDGLNDLIVAELEATGATGLEMRVHRKATLPGYYRASKAWDLLVLQHGSPVLVVEYKSMKGSEGKNLNNRADEIFGMAEDLRQAELHGLLPRKLRRAYVFVMGITPESMKAVSTSGVFGGADRAFEGRSYLDRAAIMCRRMRESGLFHLTWAVGVQEDPVRWHEPDLEVGWERFAADLRHGFIGGGATRPDIT